MQALSPIPNPESRAVYEEVGRLKNKDARSLAVGDYFHPPSVRKVDTSGYEGRIGDKVTIMADDDVAVRGVDVTVRKSDGTVLEEGPAARVFDAWVYPATTVVAPGTNLIIEVTAVDWAGNKGMKHHMLP